MIYLIAFKCKRVFICYFSLCVEFIHSRGSFIFLLSHIFPFLNQLLLDLMAFREQALRLILDLSSTVITLLVSQTPSSAESNYLLLLEILSSLLNSYGGWSS